MKERIRKRAPPVTGEEIARTRRSATWCWGEVINVPGSTVEEKAAELAALKARRRHKLPSHVWRRLLLDLVVDLTPLDKPVPEKLIALLRDELDLPANHEVGDWPLKAGMHDDRGKPDHEARECAALIDLEYIEVHATHMPLRMLVRKLKVKLGRAPDRKSLRTWRARSDYWGNRWSPPTGGGK